MGCGILALIIGLLLCPWLLPLASCCSGGSQLRTCCDLSLVITLLLRPPITKGKRIAVVVRALNVSFQQQPRQHPPFPLLLFPMVSSCNMRGHNAQNCPLPRAEQACMCGDTGSGFTISFLESRSLQLPYFEVLGPLSGSCDPLRGPS